jgi:hypothetical protein
VAYSACQIVSIWVEFDSSGGTYGSILGGLCASALEGDSVTLVLETLGSDESLDLGGLGVGLLVALGLDLAADDKLADLKISSVPNSPKLQIREFVHRRPWRVRRSGGFWWHAWVRDAWGGRRRSNRQSRCHPA